MRVTVAWSSIILAVALLGCESRHQQEIEKHQRHLRALLVRDRSAAEIDAHMQTAPYRIAGPGDAKELAAMWTNPLNSPAEVESKMTKWPQTRIYLKSPMVYFIYFDDSGVMRDFSCLSN
jgi:hypothetical protein